MLHVIARPGRTAPLVDSLAGVWRDSVKATHIFLSPGDIKAMEPEVEEALCQVDTLVWCGGDLDGIQGFMGVQSAKIEMLFVHPTWQGQGVGKKLVTYATGVLGAKYVDVNEQNAGAVHFYARMGFVPIRRDALDAAGRPFPILHLKMED